MITSHSHATRRPRQKAMKMVPISVRNYVRLDAEAVGGWDLFHRCGCGSRSMRSVGALDKPDSPDRVLTGDQNG